MSPDYRKLVQEAVAMAGADLEGKLPPHPVHPAGRNPYAHLYMAIRNRMGCSYKDCEDSDVARILDIINYCCRNPY